MTASDVLIAAAGPERDRAIDDWCRSVWAAFRESRQTIVDLLREYQIHHSRRPDGSVPLDPPRT
jgi:hypothetical protein